MANKDFDKCLFCALVFIFTFKVTFGEDSVLHSAEAAVNFGPMHNPEITERLYKSPAVLAHLTRMCG